VSEKIIFIIKTRHAISCAVNFYNAGVVTQGRVVGSRFAPQAAAGQKSIYVCLLKSRISIFLGSFL
jgi:hypothetical protein